MVSTEIVTSNLRDPRVVQADDALMVLPALICDNRRVDQTLYDELRRIAQSYMGREAAGITIQPTALVHEAFIRLAGASTTDDAHFRATASKVMRHVLVDEARRRKRQKRGGSNLRVTLIDSLAATSRDLDLLALDEALEQLAAASTRRAEVVEMRFFGGMTLEEIAEALEISPRTAESDWYLARAWLRSRLVEEDGEASEADVN